MQRAAVERRRREELKYHPQWEGSIEGWAVKFIKRNLWRVMPVYDFDDLYQEAYVRFLMLEEKYAVADPPHFMRLFQVAMVNRMHGLAVTRSTKQTALSDELLGWQFDRRMDEEVIRSLIEDIPEPARRAVKLAMEQGGLDCGSVQAVRSKMQRLAYKWRARKGREQIQALAVLQEWLCGGKVLKKRSL